MFVDCQVATGLPDTPPYKFAYDREDFASWFTHVDEHGVRCRFWRPRTGDVVLDVGADYGSYTLPALARGASRVYAVVPIPAGRGAIAPRYLLETSLRLNGWDDGRCRLVDTGLWSAPGWLRVYMGALAPEWLPVTACGPIGTLPVVTLDALAGDLELTRLDWVKLDVEGAEAEVLRGGAATIRRFRPNLLVENHLFKDPAIEYRISQELSPLGYHAEPSMNFQAFVTHTLWTTEGGVDG